MHCLETLNRLNDQAALRSMSKAYGAELKPERVATLPAVGVVNQLPGGFFQIRASGAAPVGFGPRDMRFVANPSMPSNEFALASRDSVVRCVGATPAEKLGPIYCPAKWPDNWPASKRKPEPVDYEWFRIETKRVKDADSFIRDYLLNSIGENAFHAVIERRRLNVVGSFGVRSGVLLFTYGIIFETIFDFESVKFIRCIDLNNSPVFRRGSPVRVLPD